MERPSRCERCQGLPFCDRCGTLQDPPSSLTFFDVFSIPASLSLDESKLRDAFYTLSRQLHPDRHAVAEPAVQARALRWSTLLNRAYQALRDPNSRSRYLLDLFKSPESKAGVPAELAEAYFDAEDLVAFREELNERIAAAEADWRTLAEEPWSEKQVPRLREIVDRKRYLASMLRDLEAKLT